MAYVKHPIHGNKHVEDSEVAELVKQGWVQWPRAAKDKALGDGSDAAYWRNKYAAEIAEKNFQSEAPSEVNFEGDAHLQAIEQAMSNGVDSGVVSDDSNPVEDKPRNKPGPKPKA